ncbi:MAG TPA: putative toxin-antitoxin system toxin component, PIN family [Acidobacteriaceae bacterium]|nr:putative toxin-antitoxin system toxin component, PIN family [Acidobacteriaceae bacterium]
MRIVVDANVLVSRLLLPDSTPGRAVRRVVLDHQILVSEATMAELADVIFRPKFDAYVSSRARRSFLEELTEFADWIPIVQTTRACRDPRDDKFLELAVNGMAGCILTGDADLLALHPFQEIAILTPSAWMQAEAMR